MKEIDYILKILDILASSVGETDLPGFSKITILDNIKPESFIFSIQEIKDYIIKNEEEKIEKCLKDISRGVDD